MSKTQISLLRSNSKGIKGTYANARHHAQAILPILDAIRGALPHLGFDTWSQGHNVHQFLTTDRRRFTLRPIIRTGEGYVGIRLAARISRSSEFRLMDIDNVKQVPQLLAFMEHLAQDQKGNDGALIDQNH